MASELWQSFIGDTYQALSPSIAAETAVNLYAESTGEGKAKQTTFYGTPGLSLRMTLPTGPARGLFTQDGQTWGVFGGRLYELLLDTDTYTDLGAIPTDGEPVYFASNGQAGDQLGISGGGVISVLTLSTNALTTAVLPFSGPGMLAFIDGYTLTNQVGSPVVWFSALEDMTDWDALDFFTRSGTSDDVIGIGVRRDRVKVFGSATTTDFYDSGDADTPFLPYPSTTTQIGLVSPALLGINSDVFFWVAETGAGQRRVVSDGGDSVQTISTPPIELFLSRCATLDDARMLIYEQEGHLFTVLTCPSSPDAVQTYHFDAREQLWQSRAGWDATLGVYTRWRAQGATSSGAAILVGDYSDGRLYDLDLDTYDDDGVILKRERTAPYLSAEASWVFVDQLELGMQAGVGLSSGQGSDPLVSLEISRDGARTWVSAGTASLGAIGAYTARAIWRRLGRARADRLVARVTQTDPVKTVWGPGLFIRLTSGSGQL